MSVADTIALPPPDRWFFITGCQRSGTTLLRLTLECHRDVFCFDEIEAYRVLSTRLWREPIQKRLVGFKVPRWAEQIDSSFLWDFGLPETARSIYRGQKIVFIVRDFRDAIVSMLKLGAPSWMELWAEPIIAAKIRQEPDFPIRYARQLAMCERAGHRLPALGGVYWCYKNEALIRYKEAGYPVLAVAYERLTAHPGEQLRRIRDFLGIEFSPTMLEHARQPHRELLENCMAVGSTDPRRPIDQASVGQWQNFLTPEEIALCTEIVGDLPERLQAYLL